MKIKSMAALTFIALLTTGCPLKVVQVKAPEINCVFDQSCKVTVTDTSSPIPIPAGGSNFIQSRTYIGKPGTPAAGLYAYEYRIDLRNAVGLTFIPCITSMTVVFEPVSASLDYDGDGAPDQVFVVTGGGLGNIGIASAEKEGNKITFVFDSPVCAGGQPGKGDSTYFFGLASPSPPGYSTAELKEMHGEVYSVQIRSPASE